MSSTSHAIVLDTRLWDMSRNISGVIDVCVELIINADDAYRKRFTPGPITEDVDIRVNIDYKKRYVTVCDDAIGMTFDELMSKMTRVGGYTADTTSRGYFSRGAKYIISIGDAEYEYKALINLHSNSPNSKSYRLLKSVRFVKYPTKDVLLDQIKVMQDAAIKVCTTKTHLDLKFELKQ